MDTGTESLLLTKLEKSDYTQIHRHFASHLRPFTKLGISTTDPKPQNNDPSTVRSLAKSYLSFLNRALSIFPKHLSEIKSRDSVLEVFDAYKLCLNCLEYISSQLTCKPYYIYIQRHRMLRCFEACGLYKDAENEGFLILEKIRCVGFRGSGSKLGKFKGKFLLDLGKESVDCEFGLLVVEIAVMLLKCACMNKTKDGETYRRILKLLEEVKPWFRVLDANAYEKLYRSLVTYLNKITLFMVEELACFEIDLICAFCSATLAKCAMSPMKEEIYKVGRRICSTLLSQQDKRSSLISDIIKCVLDFLASECKVEMEKNVEEFLEIVSYCANKCVNVSEELCICVAIHLNKIAGEFHQVLAPFDLILRIYAIGLHFSNGNVLLRDDESSLLTSAKDKYDTRFKLDHGERLQSLSALLGSFKTIFPIGGEENKSFYIEYSDSGERMCSHMESDHKGFIPCQRNKTVYLLFYFALKFLCQPLAKKVNSAMKQILIEDEATSISSELCAIQEAFLLLGDVFLFCHNLLYEREGDGFDANNKVVLSGAVAAFTLSFRTKVHTQKSVEFIKHGVLNAWFQHQGLKFLYVFLYNIAVILYMHKQVKEASKALKLCCRVSWACVLLLCQNVEKSERLGDLSEAAIVDFVSDACKNTSFLLDVQHQCACHKMEKIIVHSLQNWSVAGDKFSWLPNPISLVKQWVKIQCKISEGSDWEDIARTLYCLLSSSAKVSTRTVVILLEQELLAYEEMNLKYPTFCRRMQMKIMDILLENVYVTRDKLLQKSRTFIKKGKALRAHGIEGLKDSIQCLSEAISIMDDSYRDTCSPSNLVCHQLAVAYCLRAMCTQEADPNSKKVFQDIRAALNLWLCIRIPDHCDADDQCNMIYERAISLLYHVIDLLSLKGFTKFHDDIYKLIIRLFKWKNVPIEKCLAVLWEFRRLSHALCASPLNEAFIMNLSEQCGEISKSFDYWINCLQGSRPRVVGFLNNFSLFTSYCGQSSFRSHITIDEVREAALDLISRVPLPSHSVFLAGYLYYDLCERLVANGRLTEALSYAKEAHRLRNRLFQKKFSYSIELEREDCSESGESSVSQSHGLGNIEMLNSVAAEIWLCDTVSWDLEGCSLTPWNVMQCYLESTLQVGVIHEMVGNGAEAEILLKWGKAISISQGLPLFSVVFSSVLGRLYRKKQLWDLTAKELQNAKQILINSGTDVFCSKCRIILEVNIDQELGDLSRSQFSSCLEFSSVESLSYAENLYKSALDKLNLSEWGNYCCSSEEVSAGNLMRRNTVVTDVEHGASNVSAHCSIDQSDAEDLFSKVERPEAKKEVKRSRKPKKASNTIPQKQLLVTEHNVRITRSRSSQIAVPKDSNGNDVLACIDDVSQKMSLLNVKNSAIDSQCEMQCACNKINCWQCLLVEIVASGSVCDFIHLRWEFIRRQRSLKLLTGIVKCLAVRGNIHDTHEIFLRSIAILAGRTPFSHVNYSVLVASLLDIFGKEIPGDVFVLERAAVLYELCWFSLKSYNSKSTRIVCCDISEIQIPKIVSWLLLAFVLCREVPELFQKVSRLLAALFILSTSDELFSFPLSSCKALTKSHWASFFHQASIGTHLNHLFLSTAAGKHITNNLMDVEGSSVSGSTCTKTETSNILRSAPESLNDLDEFVTNFFRGLPCTNVICLSLLDGDFASLLNELLFHPSSALSWMLLSRLDSKSQPCVLLLPLNSVLQADDDSTNSDSGDFCDDNDLGKQWRCPWGSTVVDDVAPLFRSILKESCLSSWMFSQKEDTRKNRSLWWAERKKLDQSLSKLLRELEDLWFGPWKCFLLGEWSDCRRLDSIQKKLVRDLKRKCKININESLLRVILGGFRYSPEKEEFVRQLSLDKGCYIGRVRYCDSEWCKPLLISGGVENLSGLSFQLLLEALKELEQEECVDREPIILVLDCEVQMLPWENIPILRHQEVYRMPSVSSITVALAKSHESHEQLGRMIASFPFIDPLDAFYLLNPSGDLICSQVEFEDWFKNKRMEGNAGNAPTVEELAIALKNHDLFIYIGHGSGAKYIPEHKIQKLDSCAATLLMGCSSGSLFLNGPYSPQGIPLSYILAGSPVIIGNLWDVTDKDIDRFGKAMLDAWLRERSNPFSGSEDRPKIGSFVGEAREACMLPFLIGAAPVCYGVPTGIRKKKDLIALCDHYSPR